MTDVLDILEVEEGKGSPNQYLGVGFPRNPFRPSKESEDAGFTPFYTGHVRDDLQKIQGWIRDVHQNSTRQPLSLAGNVGAGKSRILTLLAARLSRLAPERVWVEVVRLREGRYARASIGGLLLTALERASQRSDAAALPPEVLPLVWSIVTVPSFSAKATGAVGVALRSAAREQANKEERARLISRWLQRVPLTPAQSARVGLFRRIDWEGELIRIVAELLTLARDLNLLGTFFFFVDQLEDLFGSGFSALRRSRILSDLRGLVDAIDEGAPIGLVLAWSPEFGSQSVETDLRDKYEALFARMERRRVNLPLLVFEHAAPFATQWINSASGEAGFEPRRQPAVEELVGSAWSRLERKGVLLPPKRATPRDLLSELAEEVDRRTGVS